MKKSITFLVRRANQRDKIITGPHRYAFLHMSVTRRLGFFPKRKRITFRVTARPSATGQFYAVESVLNRLYKVGPDYSQHGSKGSFSYMVACWCPTDWQGRRIKITTREVKSQCA